jgi:hypothetical protein
MATHRMAFLALPLGNAFRSKASITRNRPVLFSNRSGPTGKSALAEDRHRHPSGQPNQKKHAVAIPAKATSFERRKDGIA